MPASVIAVIRTGVQLLVGWALSAAWVIAALDWVATNTGVDVSRESLENAALGVATLAVVWVVNWAGKRWDWVNRIFSLGTSASPAVYDKGGTPDAVIDTGGEGV